VLWEGFFDKLSFKFELGKHVPTESSQFNPFLALFGRENTPKELKVKFFKHRNRWTMFSAYTGTDLMMFNKFVTL
jgi:hypothetical protein